MSFNYKALGLEKDNLYEILATTYSIDDNRGEIIPNAACMGIWIADEGYIKILPYPDTTTYKNLKSNKMLAINFVDDVSLYALAALKDVTSGVIKFPREKYGFKELSKENLKIPFIKEAWACLYCKVIGERQRIKRNLLGEVELTEITLEIFESQKTADSFKIYNRAENLTLEAIILATRLKVAKANDNQRLFDTIWNHIMDILREVKRFGKNQNALKGIEIVESYINYLK